MPLTESELRIRYQAMLDANEVIRLRTFLRMLWLRCDGGFEVPSSYGHNVAVYDTRGQRLIEDALGEDEQMIRDKLHLG